MNQQKRHLTVMSFIIALTLAALCYGGQAGGSQEPVAESHKDKHLCSHQNRHDAGASPAARAGAAERGRAAAGPLRIIGGQIG